MTDENEDRKNVDVDAIRDELDELDLEKAEIEIESANEYGDRHFHYEKLPPHHLDKAIEEFQDLLDTIEDVELDDNQTLPRRAIQFRYDGGSQQDVENQESAQTTAIIWGPKQGRMHGGEVTLQITSVPYKDDEDRDAGLRSKGYVILERHMEVSYDD